jgi:UDP-N-acetylmuramoylalanine--D-glutamate ligase
MLNLRDQKVVVMGLGRFGGGIGVTRYLVSQGARVLVTDQLPEAQLAQSMDKLRDLPIEYRLGAHDHDDFKCADIVVVNPAVDPRSNAYLQTAVEHRAKLTSEIRLLVAALPRTCRVIGITGTAGKSTTTAMIGTILEQTHTTGKTWVGGNIGGSLLPHVHAMTDNDIVVLELSSFMLEGLDEDKWSPQVALLTNLTDNHLDRHGTIDAYAIAKQSIFNHQHADDVAIFPPHLNNYFNSFGRYLPLHHPQEQIPLLVPGQHNQFNAHAAMLTCEQVDIDRQSAIDALSTFPGLPHRLQLVVEHETVRYFNDSKCTTPTAARLALDAFEPGCIHIILGGYDKHADLTDMATHASDVCRVIYTIGQTGPAIAHAARGGKAEVVECETLEKAVQATTTRIHRGDVVLLSPACASWDQFTNYEQRGNAFTSLVLNYSGEGFPAPLK